MTSLTTKALAPENWDDFAMLAETHNGVWGGCWYMSFHVGWTDKTRTAAGTRADNDCGANDRGVCVGWCQFGPPAELPFIKHRKANDALAIAAPDWRITCFFVGKTHRGAGGRGGGFGWAVGVDRDLGRRRGGKLPREYGGPQNVGVIPAQWHIGDV